MQNNVSIKKTINPIGYVSSCYKEKFGIPRQPALVDVALTEIYLNSVFDMQSVRGLEQFSHIWLEFIFHANQEADWKQTVRPPRLGGNQRIGVFASRSPFRPSGMGLSVVELVSIQQKQDQVCLKVKGADLLDQTPIVDIKPYVPYVDNVPTAVAGFAQEKPSIEQTVLFSEQSLVQCRLKAQQWNVDIRQLITQILQQDPRPAYRRQLVIDERAYAMKLYDFDVKWRHVEQGIEVIQLQDVTD